jgi:hypothetical protein
MPSPARSTCASIALCAAALLAAVAPSSATDTAASLRGKIFAAFAGVRSYRVTVLGSVRSLGVWVAPNRYQMTTDFDGRQVKTLIVGRDYWTLADGKWQKSGTASNNLDVDIAGLIRTAKANPAVPFVPMPDQTQDGKRVGTFGYAFKNGTQEVCNYDRATYLATRCKADELTLLYTGYNDASNTVAKP